MTMPSKKPDAKAKFARQRDRAAETGDQKTTDAIYKKLGRKAPNVDADRVNKGILAAAPFAGAGALGAARAVGGAARAAAPAIAAGLARLKGGATAGAAKAASRDGGRVAQTAERSSAKATALRKAAKTK